VAEHAPATPRSSSRKTSSGAAPQMRVRSASAASAAKNAVGSPRSRAAMRRGPWRRRGEQLGREAFAVAELGADVREVDAGDDHGRHVVLGERRAERGDEPATRGSVGGVAARDQVVERRHEDRHDA
jgi:hypothetical protein